MRFCEACRTEACRDLSLPLALSCSLSRSLSLHTHSLWHAGSCARSGGASELCGERPVLCAAGAAPPPPRSPPPASASAHPEQGCGGGWQ
eukprot:2969935-Rhodomonas_salina.2